MKIKVCGMRDPQNIVELTSLPIDYIGFIFYEKSPRFVGETFPTHYVHSIPKNIKKTGVFVNTTKEYIVSKIETYKLDCIQLHGNESPEFCKEFTNKGITTIKAFGIDSLFDFSMLYTYNESCTYFLFDTKTPQHGGAGVKFDWSVLNHYKGKTPFFLSGGISSDDISDIKSLIGLPIECIDINSRFEISPALKDILLIKNFIDKLKND